MPIKKCPECGGKVSSTLDTCPHCGYRLKEVVEPEVIDVIDTPKEVVLANRKKCDNETIGIVLLIVGVVATGFIVGIFLIVIGALMWVDASNNNKNTHEIASYDVENRKVKLYTVNGEKREVNPEDILGFSNSFINSSLQARIKIESGSTTLTLGGCDTENLERFKKALEEIKNGTFNPASYL